MNNLKGLALLLGLLSFGAQAATISVDETAPGSGLGMVEPTDDGLCSIKEAIDNANDDAATYADCTAGSGADTIVLPSDAVFTILTASVLDDTNYGNTALPHITSEVTIEGNGSVIERDGTLSCGLNGARQVDEFRLLLIADTGELLLRQATLRNGCASGQVGVTSPAPIDGGGILVYGVAKIEASLIESNQAKGTGGGISASDDASVVLNSVLVANNKASSGGGVYISNGSMEVINSTFINNSAGAEVYFGSELKVSETSAKIVSSTFSNNTALTAIRPSDSTLVIKNSVINGNLNSERSTVTFAGANFANGTDLPVDANLTLDADLDLLPLGDYGGPTPTIAIGHNSAALDAVTDCTLIDGSTPVAVDQRGAARPQDSTGDGTANCDAGAYEVVPPTIPAQPPVTVEATGLNTDLTAEVCTQNGMNEFANPLTPVPSQTEFAVGDWTIDCIAVDAIGFQAVATQSVSVVDSTAPVVTPPANIAMEATGLTTPVALGPATATDLVDGSLTPTPDNAGPFPVGVTIVTWSATDSANNTGVAQQLVTISDSTAPIVALLGDPAATLSTGDAWVDPGATATDIVDGNLTADIVVTGAVDSATPGSYSLVYSATDNANNIGHISRTVTVVDASAPTVTPPADIVMEATEATTVVALGTATATDLVDGTLTPTPDNSGPFPVGVTIVSWSATDSANNTGVAQQTVTITDTTAPAVVLLGETSPALSVGAAWDDPGATAADIVDGDLTVGITTSGTVNTSAPGIYPITYSVTDTAGNTGQAVRNVMVGSVTSFSGTTVPESGAGEAATVSVIGGGADCGFDYGSFEGVDAFSTASPAFTNFNKGLVDFMLSHCTAGATVTITMSYASAVGATHSLVKYGSTAAKPTPHWHEHPATISGNTVTYQLTDGGAGDADSVPDGRIVDPAGMAQATNFNLAPIPVNSPWALLVLILAMMGIVANGSITRTRLR